MKNFVFAAMNLGGILLVVIGVFIFGGSLSSGNPSLRLNSESGFFLIMLGLILFGASFIANKFFRGKF